jgi:hypothetical protein
MRQQRKTRKQEDLLKELRLLIRSRYGLIWLKTIDEEQTESLLKYLADSLNLPLFLWTLTGGLRRYDLDKPVYRTNDPKVAMDHIQSSSYPGIYYFQGLAPLLEDRVLACKLMDCVRMFTEHEGILITTGSDMMIPDSTKAHCAVLTPPTPGREEFEDLVRNIYRDLKNRMSVKMELSSRDMNRLLNNLQGLTLMEAEKILTKAMIEDGRLDADDINLIIQEKKLIVEREGLLEFIPVDQSLVDVADLRSLKSWLAKRKKIITDPGQAAEFQLSFPKGILLLGVPGSGKSLCAKAVAMEWGLPLLKMDPSRLYNKYVGESEKNFKRAMEAAEKLSPVLLWIDEIEKAFSSAGEEDSGVSQRVLGIFLSWMQERAGDVFIAATANDISRLPPEFLRKGRFDEVFFVDLPDESTRAEIFRIHLDNRGRDPGGFDLDALARATDGFTGAEIEQVIVSALYTAFSDSTSMSTGLLLDEVSRTCPLSETRREHVRALREWAKTRTVSAQ